MDTEIQESKLVFIETFGCQMNDSDSERILSQLKKIDYHETEDPERANLLLLNTCTIREKPEHKVYSMLGRFRLLKQKKPEVIIGVGGCVAQQEGERLLKKVNYVDLVFGTANINKLPALLKTIENDKQRLSATDLPDFIDPSEFRGYSYSHGRMKAFVTIMRGCNNYCSYCIVPYVRGGEISRDSKEILAEINTLAKSGVKEITLLGQNVNSYGNDGNDLSFAALLKDTCLIKGVERVRFVTSNPKDLSDEIISLFSHEKKLCAHIHLPVQSGSNKILKAMNRRYDREDYLSRVERLRKASPDIAITTDIIVGFPGETERDYMDTIDLLKIIEFDNIYSFAYSKRHGTMAANLDGQLSHSVKNERLRQLQKMQKEITLGKNRQMVGQIAEVLIDSISKASVEEIAGRTRCNRIVNFSGPKEWISSTIEVIIEHAYTNSLRGKPLGGVATC